MREQIIVCDTREQKDSHITEWFDLNGIRTVRSKLYVGDYALLNDQSVCIDRKAGLQEVYGNVVQQHDRFKRELIRARDANIKVIFLVEQPEIMRLADVADWQNPRWALWVKRGRKGWPPMPSVSLMKAMRSISEKYGAEWLFCDKSQTAQRIVEVLMYGF